MQDTMGMTIDSGATEKRTIRISVIEFIRTIVCFVLLSVSEATKAALGIVSFCGLEKDIRLYISVIFSLSGICHQIGTIIIIIRIAVMLC